MVWLQRFLLLVLEKFNSARFLRRRGLGEREVFHLVWDFCRRKVKEGRTSCRVWCVGGFCVFRVLNFHLIVVSVLVDVR